MPPEIGDQGYAILTLVGLNEPVTAYNVERILGVLANEFWSAPHTQIYRECDRLVEAGLLRASQEKGGRRRRLLSLTARGRREVTAWVRTPTDRTIEISDIAQVKLMGSELSTSDDVVALARVQVDAYARRIEALEEIQARFGDREDLSLRFQGVPLGLAVYRAAFTFWQNVADNPPVLPS